ncbi:hypothetical protein QO179_23520 [Bacillus stercoris]|nr:hypothetical protein [Bacillus stercoris]
MDSVDPKVLRAQAKQLLELARTIEMAQDPQKFMNKKIKSKVSGMKRKARNSILKNIGF